MKCPKCGYENLKNAKYCNLCYEVLEKIRDHKETIMPTPQYANKEDAEISMTRAVAAISMILFIIIFFTISFIIAMSKELDIIVAFLYIPVFYITGIIYLISTGILYKKGEYKRTFNYYVAICIILLFPLSSRQAMIYLSRILRPLAVNVVEPLMYSYVKIEGKKNLKIQKQHYVELQSEFQKPCMVIDIRGSQLLLKSQKVVDISAYADTPYINEEFNNYIKSEIISTKCTVNIKLTDYHNFDLRYSYPHIQTSRFGNSISEHKYAVIPALVYFKGRLLNIEYSRKGKLCLNKY